MLLAGPEAHHALHVLPFKTVTASPRVSRTVERRQRALVRTSGPETRALGEELSHVRRELARLMMSPDAAGA